MGVKRSPKWAPFLENEEDEQQTGVIIFNRRCVPGRQHREERLHRFLSLNLRHADCEFVDAALLPVIRTARNYFQHRLRDAVDELTRLVA